MLMILFWCGPLVFGCGDDIPAATREQLATPLVGVWYSATAKVQVRAIIKASGPNFSMSIGPTADGETTYWITGELDHDGRHLNAAVIINGAARQCIGFASADSQRMFFGIRDEAMPEAYSDAWTFVRTR